MNGIERIAAKGCTVGARMHNGCFEERIVWDLDGDTAYLCTAPVYENLLLGDWSVRPVGFHISDIRPTKSQPPQQESK